MLSKITQRHLSIVCVGAARPSDTEMPGLCSDAELRRNEWPWIGE